MKKILLILTAFNACPVFSDVPPEQKDEVDHLLEFVRTSHCIMKRNGDKHNSDKAADHIESKYDYFRDDIKNTEDFIKYSATKSTMSGKYYTVVCPEKKEIKSEKWLLDELSRFRFVSSSSFTRRPQAKLTRCTEPRPEICTMQYLPVCANLKDGSAKTYSSGCSACSDVNVVSYMPEECAK